MQQVLGKPIVVPVKVKRVAAKKTYVRSRVVFNFVMIMTIACASFALIRVVQYALYNQFALENEQFKQRIAAEEQIRQELFSRKLSLESPQRIEAIAKGKLKMIRPNNVRYLVFNEVRPSSKKLAYIVKK